MSGGKIDSMKNISLKWRIFWFYCALGLLPQAAISYISIDAYTHSLEEVYDKQATSLVTRVAEQTANRAQYLVQALVDLAAQPYMQLSFQQYPHSRRLLLIRERMALFRDSASEFTRLSLCDLNGDQLVTLSEENQQKPSSDFERDAIVKPRQSLPFHRLLKRDEQLHLVFFTPVISFRQSTNIVGYLVGYVPFTHLMTYLDKLELGYHAEKTVLDADGKLVKAMCSSGGIPPQSKMRTYIACLKKLDLNVVVRIAEDDLLRDVYWLKHKNMVFICGVIVLALITSFIFSYYFTNPFKMIIAGTQAFAGGDLSHQITVQSGFEAIQLATAFNEMARQVNDRQRELNRATRLASLGTMTAGIAHEIKNPLSGIKTSSQVIHQLLTDGLPGLQSQGPSQQMSGRRRQIAELSEDISNEVDRLAKILNDLLEFGRPQPAKKMLCDLAKIVNQVYGIVRSKFEKRQVKVALHVQSLKVYGDPNQLLQVILNLMLNALEAVSSGTGVVVLSSEISSDGAPVLKICDNGIGIAEDKQKHIFDPFYSLRENGTGLGLSVVYTFLKQNEATVNVDSQPGAGTVFGITFCSPPVSIKDIGDG
jgi:signal transduction histidine kinase